MNFTQEDIDFLESEAHNGITSTLDSSGAYVRDLDHGIKQHYENVYRRVIEPTFVLCFHCNHDVFKLVRDTHLAYNKFKAAAPVAAEAPAPVTVAPPAHSFASDAEARKVNSRVKAKAKPAQKIVGEGDE